MRDHFRLQRTLLERQLIAWRLAPWLVYVVAPLLFVGIGLLLLQRSEYLSWAIVFAGFSAIRPLSSLARNDFFRGLYRGGKYQKIRITENALVLLPFVLFLLVESILLRSLSCGAGALVLGLVGISGAWWTDRPRFARGLPTPFSARPFEYAVGFRKYWWVLLIAIYLLGQGVWVENFELAAFALFVVGMIGAQLVQEPEPGFYVWIYATPARVFLHRKLLLTTQQQLGLLAPFAVVTLAVFPEQWGVSLFIIALTAGFQVFGLLMKYSHFPHRLNVGHGFILALGLVVFPTLLILIPLYYQRALARLAILLPDD